MSKAISGVLIYCRADAEKNMAFIDHLLSESDKLGIGLELLYLEDLILGIQHGRPFVRHSKIDFSEIDFAIVRAISPLLSRQLEMMGVRCFNSAGVSEICNNKASTHQFASALGIPMADTIMLTESALPKDMDFFAFPLILKEVDGRSGQQVYCVNSVEECDEILQSRPHKQFILQKMIQPAGKDIRVFVLGGKIIGAVLRESTNSFKANYTLGGTATAYQLSELQVSYVNRIAEALNPDFVGIDFLIDDKGNSYFNEIEDIVGSRTLYATTNLNVAGLYMSYIREQMQS